MTRILAHRATGRNYSIVAYVLYAVGRVLAEHSEANAAIRDGHRPTIARYRGVNAKLALDKTIGDQRVVVSAVLPDVDIAGLDEIQDRVEHYREADPERSPDFAGVRALHRLPWPVRGAIYRAAIRPLAKRANSFGTVSVTSLGHRPVDGFYSVGGTTLTLGVGRILERPVVRDGGLTTAPMMRLSLTFDHRVIDGAAAADVLAELRETLESFSPATDSRNKMAAAEVAELKQFVVVHARGQRIPGYQDVLDRIRTDGSGPGSWTFEWSAAAAELERQGRLVEATRCYGLARFPYVDGPARKAAQDKCVAVFDTWRSRTADGIESVEADIAGHRIRSWAVGLDSSEPRPLVIVMGGIVTVKEQWAPALALYRRLGFAAIAAEMPGVGENSLRYDKGSWQMIPGLLDAVAERADVAHTYAVALSFSGHMALRAAVADARIRGIVTTSAPIEQFFTDVDWQHQLPRITVDTMAAMNGSKPAELIGRMADWALTAEQFAALDIPIHYMKATRDEIIPCGNAAFLRAHAKQARFLEHDDVHGAPGHVVETQLWCVRSLLSMHGVRGPRAWGIDLLWHLQRARAHRHS